MGSAWGGKTFQIKTIDDIPNYYAKIAQQLFKQPVMGGKQDLKLKYEVDGAIISKLGVCCIFFDWHENTISRISGVSQAPELIIFKKFYTKRITQLKKNWKKCDPKNYPKSLNMSKKPKDWLLYSNKRLELDEYILIRALASKFDLRSKISVSSDYQNNIIYLWVEKSHLEEFNKAFKFNLQK